MSEEMSNFTLRKDTHTLMKMNLNYIVTNGEALFRSWRWGKMVYCPYCGSLHIYKGKGRYKCADCNHRFSDTTGTLFHATKLSLGTLTLAIYLNIQNRGISSYNLGEQCGITQKAAWRLQTKIRFALDQRNCKVSGDVAVDEAYICGSLKWKHFKEKLKLYAKYDIIVENGKPTQPQSLMLSRRRGVPVIGLHDGETLVMEHVEAPVLSQSIINVINAHNGGVTHLTTDESHLYFPLAKLWETTTMNHKKHIYAWDGYSSNRIENPFGWWNSNNQSNHRHQKEEYIQGYFNLFVFRRNTRKMEMSDRLGKAFGHFRFR